MKKKGRGATHYLQRTEGKIVFPGEKEKRSYSRSSPGVGVREWEGRQRGGKTPGERQGKESWLSIGPEEAKRKLLG